MFSSIQNDVRLSCYDDKGKLLPSSLREDNNLMRAYQPKAFDRSSRAVDHSVTVQYIKLVYVSIAPGYLEKYINQYLTYVKRSGIYC